MPLPVAIEHAALRPEATVAEVLEGAAIAASRGCVAVCVAPAMVHAVVLGGFATIAVAGITVWKAPKLRRLDLRERVALAIARLQGCRSQRRTELLLSLSQGYLSRLKAGDGIPGAPLVCLLALLARHPELLGELEDYWTLPLKG